ncbi:hypothetical protein [Nocardioides sp. HDW12B]|uniref:hypothetical protein n=1 Tax=Nocardioides sp. HDW12B TaxID=2714939 RepID=UPI0019814731|nr:hypothetical protein [Nocardioides sp. HDW12B]
MIEQGAPRPSSRSVNPHALVWYAAYGSNLHVPRLTCYLAGGTPPGSRRTYLGARDPSPPRATASVWLPGRLRFAGDSPVWGGGVAVLETGDRAGSPTPVDRAGSAATVSRSGEVAAQAPGDRAGSAATVSRSGEVAAQAYLLTHQQVCDIVAQETRREAGAVSVLEAPLGGAGWYDALVTGELDGHPLVALAATDPPPPNAPGATYLTMLMDGLRAAHGWSPEECADYVGRWPGAESWTRESLVRLAERTAPTVRGT